MAWLRTPSRWLLLAIALFLAAGAIPVGLGFAVRPDGSLVGMPRSVLAGSPFTDFLIPGLLLAVAVGGSTLTAAVSRAARVGRPACRSPPAPSWSAGSRSRSGSSASSARYSRWSADSGSRWSCWRHASLDDSEGAARATPEEVKQLRQAWWSPGAPSMDARSAGAGTWARDLGRARRRSGDRDRSVRRRVRMRRLRHSTPPASPHRPSAQAPSPAPDRRGPHSPAVRAQRAARCPGTPCDRTTGAPGSPCRSTVCVLCCPSAARRPW